MAAEVETRDEEQSGDLSPEAEEEVELIEVPVPPHQQPTGGEVGAGAGPDEETADEDRRPRLPGVHRAPVSSLESDQEDGEPGETEDPHGPGSLRQSGSPSLPQK